MPAITSPAPIGRASEQRALIAFLQRAIVNGDALRVTGGPGVGKTTLLATLAAAAAALGVSVFGVGGLEFAADVPYAGLAQLVGALLVAHGDALLAPQRSALASALGMQDGPQPGRLLVGNAAISLLRAASARQPVLLVADDTQWIDAPSVGVFGFVARRVHGARVGFVLAGRPAPGEALQGLGLQELAVGPLDSRAAHAVLRRHHPGLAPTVRERVVAEARGNPLALLELPGAMSAPQRAALEPLPPGPAAVRAPRGAVRRPHPGAPGRRSRGPAGLSPRRRGAAGPGQPECARDGPARRDRRAVTPAPCAPPPDQLRRRGPG